VNAVKVNVVAEAIDRLANPARISDPDKLRSAVSGKTVLVTGASYGIGEATARRLAAAGATVLVVARSAERLDDLAASINAGGGQAVAYPTDLTEEAAVSALTKQVTEDHGPLDIVVSNAGKSLRRSLHHQYDRPHDFQRTIDINYLGPIWLLLGLLPAMRENGGGHIVNVSSVGVRVVPGPQWGAYQASKGAFDRWLRSVAPELHADGVDVTSVYFALVRTRMIAPTPFLGRLPGLSPDQAAGSLPIPARTTHDRQCGRHDGAGTGVIRTAESARADRGVAPGSRGVSRWHESLHPAGRRGGSMAAAHRDDR
jgi:NAD(P)-dependent dehydrogenase (short-subunit alcohol dehydrogenase family)